MALTARTPTTVLLTSGRDWHERVRSDIPAIETITPGYWIEYHNDSGTLKWGVHDSADGAIQRRVALDKTYNNEGLTGTYAAGDLVDAYAPEPGDVLYLVAPSGQTITQGDYLQSNGDGKVKALGSGTAIVIAAETIGAVAADTRLRAEVI